MQTLSGILGRQPILWTAFISAALTVLGLWIELTTIQLGALNGLGLAFVALVANVSVTPTGDARLANGTQINSGASVVVPVDTLKVTPAAAIIKPPATDNAPKVK